MTLKKLVMEAWGITADEDLPYILLATVMMTILPFVWLFWAILVLVLVGVNMLEAYFILRTEERNAHLFKERE